MSVYESAEWRALVAAVVAAPDDDLPRLVAADFPEERDPDDRLAAAIRFEVGPSGWGREAHGWVFRAGEPLPAPVFDSHLATIDQLGDLAWPEGTRFTFRRGFVESVSCPAAAWLAHGDDVLKQHPVRRVRLTTLENEVPGWRAMRHISSAGQMHWLTDRWPGIEFELPPPDEPEVISVRGVPVVMRPDLGGPAIDWSGTRLGPPVTPARVRVEGYLDPETGLPVVPGDD